jgi:hypothetical protein
MTLSFTAIKVLQDFSRLVQRSYTAFEQHAAVSPIFSCKQTCHERLQLLQIPADINQVSARDYSSND